VVDESASKLSYEEFSRQFLAELEYDKERKNLEEVYESSLDPSAPYIQHGVLVPRVFPSLCTNRVITMTYLPGPKFEEEAKRQLEMVGISTNRSIRDVVKEATKDTNAAISSGNSGTADAPVILSTAPEGPTQWQLKMTQFVGKWIGVDSVLSMLRVARKLLLWSKYAAASSINAASALPLVQVPSEWAIWANEHENMTLQIARLDWTHQAVYALFDVHGYQIFNQGLFNADPHPGNLLIVQEETSKSVKPTEKIGLIDFGQCKRLTQEERVKVAKLLLSVAENAPDDKVATHFRDLGIQTKNDSTRFLAEFARLMFGSFRPEHMNHSWHKELHKEDKVLYFPTELSMVYRTSLLLRGLAMSLQLNVSVGDLWRHHAQSAIGRENTI
jgi:aarF domain-containing kinase